MYLRKPLLGQILLLLLFSQVGFFPACARAEIGGSSPVYREIFSPEQYEKDSVPQGFTVDAFIGSTKYTPENGNYTVKIREEDTNENRYLHLEQKNSLNTLNLQVRKSIGETVDLTRGGLFVLEFKVKTGLQPSISKYFRLRTDSSVVNILHFNSTGLLEVLNNAALAATNVCYATGDWNHVKMVFNTVSQTSRVYFNDMQHPVVDNSGKTDRLFSISGGIDRFEVSMYSYGAGKTDEYGIDDIKMYYTEILTVPQGLLLNRVGESYLLSWCCPPPSVHMYSRPPGGFPPKVT